MAILAPTAATAELRILAGCRPEPRPVLKPLLITLSLITALPLSAAARQTPAEASGYTATPRYAETMDWLRAVAGEHPWVRITDFGTSAQGRALPLVVIASEGELIAQLRPGEDGLILEDGARRGTFLPKVWEALPDPAAFLAALKVKAGLPRDHWSAGLRVWRYGTDRFGGPAA